MTQDAHEKAQMISLVHRDIVARRLDLMVPGELGKG